MNSVDYMNYLSREQLYSMINELQRKNDDLECHLLTSESLLKSYQKYTDFCDKNNETFATNEEYLDLRQTIEILKSFQQKSCFVSLKPLSDSPPEDKEPMAATVDQICDEKQESFETTENDEDFEDMNSFVENNCLVSLNISEDSLKGTDIDGYQENGENVDQKCGHKLEVFEMKEEVKDFKKGRGRRRTNDDKSQISTALKRRTFGGSAVKGKFVCGYKGCPAVLKSEMSLKYHRNRHTDKYLCGLKGCPFRAGGQSALALHKSKLHSKASTQRTPFRSQEYLKSRLSKNIVVSLKRFRCEVEGCWYSAKSRSHLRTHLSYHSDERPYPCPLEHCNSRFKVRDDLRGHLRKSHKMDNNRISRVIPPDKDYHLRKYPCHASGCRYRARKLSHLERHMIYSH